MEDPNIKVPDLYFKVVDPGLQVADLKDEAGELRSGVISPNLTLAYHWLQMLRISCAVIALQPGPSNLVYCGLSGVVPYIFHGLETISRRCHLADGEIRGHSLGL